MVEMIGESEVRALLGLVLKLELARREGIIGKWFVGAGSNGCFASAGAGLGVTGKTMIEATGQTWAEVEENFAGVLEERNEWTN